MTDEFALYRTDPAAWARLVAPRWVPVLDNGNDERTLAMWRMAREELKREVWALADEKLRERIKTLTSRNPATKETT